jgi:hypothetical protein
MHRMHYINTYMRLVLHVYHHTRNNTKTPAISAGKEGLHRSWRRSQTLLILVSIWLGIQIGYHRD